MKNKLLIKIVIAIGLAILVGSFINPHYEISDVSVGEIFQFFGDLFLDALNLVVVPLVSSSIISGVARIGRDNSFGKIGIKATAYYLGTSLIAIVIGLIFANLIRPGAGAEHLVEQASKMAASTVEIQKHVQTTSGLKNLMHVISSVIPRNILAAFSQGQMLGLIFFSFLFGAALSKIDSKASSVLYSFWHGIFQIMMRITSLVIKFMPFAVFFLVANVVATTGFSSFSSLGLFIATVLAGLAVYLFIVLPLLLRVLGKINPIKFFKYMSSALITAFSTSSSAATIPVTIECLEEEVGISNRIASFIVPLGTSVNLSGSALYECVAALFIAQVYGIDLSFLTQFIVLFVALLASLGVAGVPSGSLVAVLVIISSIGLPAHAISLVIVVDRILDMCRTTVNVFGDAAGAAIIARTEGEDNIVDEIKKE